MTLYGMSLQDMENEYFNTNDPYYETELYESMRDQILKSTNNNLYTSYVMNLKRERKNEDRKKDKAKAE